jgi:hypothetical protein
MAVAQVRNQRTSVIYATVQAAVTAALNGDVLLIQTGRYVEEITIYDKQLELRGRYNADFSAQITGASVLEGTGWPDPTMVATNVVLTLRDLEITGGAAGGSRGGGLDFQNGCLTVQQCRVYQNAALSGAAGLDVWAGTAVLLDTVLCSNTAYGSLSGGGGAAIGGGMLVMGGATRVFDNSCTGGFGGGVRVNNAVVQLRGTSARITGNRARRGGGVSASWGGVHVLDGADICGNSATEHGGGIYLGWSGTAIVAGITSYVGHDNTGLGPNLAGENGGGICALYESRVVISNSAGVIHNRAGQYGGGIYLSTGAYCLVNGGMIGTETLAVTNYAGTSGGGVYILSGTLVLTNGAQVTRGHAASGGGGGVYLSDGTLQMTSNTLLGARNAGLGNQAGANGGGLFARYATLRLTDALIQHNRAMDDGGGIYLLADPVLTCRGGSIRNCLAGQDGGGVCARFTSGLHPRVVFDQTAIESNEASRDGGGIYWYAATPLLLSNSVVGYNMAGGNGGGIRKFGFSSTIELHRTALVHNYTGNDGGGAYLSSGLLRLTDADMSYNLADNDTSLDGNGGALAVQTVAAAAIIRAVATNVLLRGNTAVQGGALYADHGSLTLEAGSHTIELRQNSANVHGGAAYLVNRATLSGGNAVRIHLSRARAGGAIYADGTSSVVLVAASTTGLLVYANTAITTGGAFCIIGPATTLTLSNVAVGISGNGNGATGAYACGGGVALLRGAAATLVRTHVIDNRGDYRGGGIYAENAALWFDDAGAGATGPLPATLLLGNRTTNALGAGGGAYLDHSTMTAINLAALSNQSAYGGALYLADSSTALVINAVFVHNRATVAGGALRPYQSCVYLLHCTVADNDASGVECGSTVRAVLTNCIVWGHSGTGVSAGQNVAYCDVAGGYASGSGNIVSEPLFSNPTTLDYQLMSGSPCIDTGIYTAVPTDCLGEPRPYGPRVDLGAYEVIPEPTAWLLAPLLLCARMRPDSGR